MSVSELMVAICVMAVIAAIAIPCYITYVQQARVISKIMPRLRLVESNVTLFYHMHGVLPSVEDEKTVLDGIATEELAVKITNGMVVMTIEAPEPDSKLHILDGKKLIAAPVIGSEGISSWHLAGELADRLQLSY